MYETSLSLNPDELETLDQFLLNRVEDEVLEEGEPLNSGILDLSMLDGFFTAIVSGPGPIPPALWIPAVWGDIEPVWEDEEDFDQIVSLMMRHMNDVIENLQNRPDEFEPIFLEREIDGYLYTLVDNWCEGYRYGIELSAEAWQTGGERITSLVAPIMAFTQATEWSGYQYDDDEIEAFHEAILRNIPLIHAFWPHEDHREEKPAAPIQFIEPQAGRDDPCPCGSGKAFRKCCLH